MNKLALTRQFYYVPYRIQNRFCDKAARVAVLGPLFGRSRDREQIGLTLTRLLGLWRHRVRDLADSGWPPAANRAGVFKLLNCCYAMAWMRAIDKKTKERVPEPPAPLRCRCSRICPFCYATDVTDIYCRLSSWLDQQRSPVEFVYRTHTERGTVNDFRGLFAEQHVRSRAEVHKLEAIAAFVRIAVAPAQANRSGQLTRAWLVRRHVLVARPSKAPTSRRILVGNDNKSRRRLVGLVGTANRYPVGLLRSDRVDDVVDLLSVRVRSVKTMGEWYNMTETDGSQDDQ